MIVFGFGGSLRAHPGQGRDYYDDRLPADVLRRLKETVSQTSPGLRGYVRDVKCSFLLDKDPAFYEGMTCGLAMAAQMLADLAADNEQAAQFYDGVRGIIGLQAGVLAGHVLDGRVKADGEPEADRPGEADRSPRA